MKRTRKLNGYFCTAIALVFLVAAMSQSAYADKGPLYGHTKATKATKKLWRGLGNVTFGWVEIPWNIHKNIQDLDPFTGTFVGIYEGGKKGLSRTVAGVSEIATFPFPRSLPVPIGGLATQKDYSPVITPEFVLQDMFDPTMLKKLPTTPLKQSERRSASR